MGSSKILVYSFSGVNCEVCIYIFTYIYIHIYVCMCILYICIYVCVYVRCVCGYVLSLCVYSFKSGVNWKVCYLCMCNIYASLIYMHI